MRSIANNASYLFGAQIISRGLRVIYIVLLARILGPELYGLLAFAQSWYLAFLPLTLFGTGTILIRQISRNRANASAPVSQTLSLKLIATIFAFAACGVMSMLANSEEDVRALVLTISVALIGRSIANWSQGVFAAFEATHHTLHQEGLFRTLEIVAAIFVLFGGGGVLAVAIVHAVSWWMQALHGLWVVWGRLVGGWAGHGLSEVWRLFRLSAPLSIGGIAYVWQLQGPVILFRHIGGEGSEFGNLALVFQVLGIALALPTAISVAAAPIVNRAVARADGKELLYSEAMVRFAFLLGTTGALCGMALGPWLAATILGAEFVDAGELVGLVFWVLMPLSCTVALRFVFVAHDRYWLPQLFAVIGALTTTAAIIVLGRSLGPTGVIVGALAGAGVDALLLLTYLRTFVPIDVERIVIRPSLVCAVVTVTSLWLLQYSSAGALFVGLTLLTLGFLGCGIIRSDERKWIFRILARRPPSEST